MRIQDIIDQLQTAAIDAGAVDVKSELANWEDDFTRDDEYFRNYRNAGSEDVLAVVEHATRRGPNLELILRVQIGRVEDYPADVKDAKDLARRKQEAADIMADAAAEAARIQREAEARAAKVLGA